jgi:hypothetical protein
MARLKSENELREEYEAFRDLVASLSPEAKKQLMEKLKNQDKERDEHENELVEHRKEWR